MCDSVGQSVSAHTFSALLNSSDGDVASDAVKILAKISQKSGLPLFVWLYLCPRPLSLSLSISSLFLLVQPLQRI